jgi:hypothetical protein
VYGRFKPLSRAFLRHFSSKSKGYLHRIDVKLQRNCVFLLMWLFNNICNFCRNTVKRRLPKK